MAQSYADVIIDISHENVDKIFTYSIPDELKGEVAIGSRVLVPFGNSDRHRSAYVVGITEDAEGIDPEKIKPIAGMAKRCVNADSRLIELAWWMKQRYGSTMNQALKAVLPVKKAVKARNKKVVETMVADTAGDEAPIVLSAAQQAIADEFATCFDLGDNTPFYIHGITGSGKTEVYMEMISHVISRGKQAIVLIPEIALTYQTVLRFYRRFGDRISVMHSRLSAGEKYDQSQRAKDGRADIMIGPRSALFTPFPDLGLIVMDEEQEGAYISDTSPRYNTREVAQKLAQMSGAAFVMGSATPSLQAYTMAKAGLYKLFVLDERAGGGELAKTEVVDLREELRSGNASVFSRRLRELIRDRLDKGEQIMLFMNRRGYSNFVSCRSCGNAIRCPHCDVSLTLHEKNKLICHYCGYSAPLPKICPVCGSKYLAGFGIGTQKLEELTRELFPDARILRMDSDTTGKKGGHEALLSAFAKGEADILIGTQMIVKGHDFPKVTLVGIIAADTTLNAPDYTCAERTFQLLVQAAGRAGRGEKPGTALIQTYMPEHYSISSAARQDYDEFYRREMAFRRLMSYPPCTHMCEITIAGKEEELTAHMMDQVAASVKSHFGDLASIIGPVNAPVYKVNDFYRKLLYIKNENYDILVRIREYIDKRWEETQDCRRLSIQYDIR